MQACRDTNFVRLKKELLLLVSFKKAVIRLYNVFFFHVQTDKSVTPSTATLLVSNRVAVIKLKISMIIVAVK